MLVENDRGAAWNVIYAKAKPTPMHRHRYFFAGLDLSTATIRVTQPDASRSPPADGETKAGAILQKPFNAEALKRFLADAVAGTADRQAIGTGPVNRNELR